MDIPQPLAAAPNEACSRLGPKRKPSTNCGRAGVRSRGAEPQPRPACADRQPIPAGAPQGHPHPSRPPPSHPHLPAALRYSPRPHGVSRRAAETRPRCSTCGRRAPVHRMTSRPMVGISAPVAAHIRKAPPSHRPHRGTFRSPSSEATRTPTPKSKVMAPSKAGPRRHMPHPSTGTPYIPPSSWSLCTSHRNPAPPGLHFPPP